MEINRFIRRALLISFVYVILLPASYAVNPEKLSEDQYVQAYFNMYGDYLSGTKNVTKEELNDVVEYYLTTGDIAKNLHDAGHNSGEMIGSILADSGVDFDCGTCDASVLNQRCCIYRIGEKPMMYECVGTEVKTVTGYEWKNIYECSFGCCSNKCCRDSNPTTTDTGPTTSTKPSTTTSSPGSTTTFTTTSTTNPTATSSTTTTSGTTTTTGLDNCQSDTDCVNKHGGCYICPYKGADCSKGSANCVKDADCSDYGSGWTCISQCCIPPGATTSTTASTSTSTTVPTTTTSTAAPTTTSSTSTSTVTSSTTTSTIETMNIVWVSEKSQYGSNDNTQFMEIAKAAEAFFLTKYPVKDCSNPAERVKFYYLGPDKCDITCDPDMEICHGCIDNARDCVKNNGLGGIYDKIISIVPSNHNGAGCAGGIPFDGATIAGYSIYRLREIASHELGHTYGLCHIPLCSAVCNIASNDCSWCSNYADIQDPHDWDIMSYCDINEKFGPAGYDHLKSEFKKCLSGC